MYNVVRCLFKNISQQFIWSNTVAYWKREYQSVIEPYVFITHNFHGIFHSSGERGPRAVPMWTWKISPGNWQAIKFGALQSKWQNSYNSQITIFIVHLHWPEFTHFTRIPGLSINECQLCFCDPPWSTINGGSTLVKMIQIIRLGAS